MPRRWGVGWALFLLIAVTVATPAHADDHEPVDPGSSEPDDPEPHEPEPDDPEPPPPPPPPPPAPTTSRLVPLTPCRLFDSRTSAAPLSADDPVFVPAVGVCGIPSGARAVALTLTTVRPSSDTAVVVWPAGQHQPPTSNLNARAGETRANSAIVPLGWVGGLWARSSGGGHLIVDVTAVFMPAATSTAGRFVPVIPRRLVDTRTTARPAVDSSVRIPVPAGLPADATALALNVTVTRGQRPGFVTVYPAGGHRPLASALNTDAPGQTRAAMVIAPMSAAGVDVHTSAGDHVVVDMTGWFTGPTAADSGDGLFTPIAALRLADTRSDGPRLYRGGTREWPLPALGAPASAVAANVTLVRSDRPGFMVAFPARTPLTLTSTVNTEESWHTVANMALTPVSTAGLALHTPSGGHAVVDITGWFSGTPHQAVTGPPRNERPVPGHTLIVTDSTGAALRWHPQSQADLRGFTYVLDGESCRRTTGVSCRGREGRTPTITPDAIAEAVGYFDTVVVMTGYNDWHTDFARGIDETMDAARRRGVARVVWLTLRTEHGYSMPGQVGNSGTNHDRNNVVLHEALHRHPDLLLADWNAHSFQRDAWFADDGVHFTPAGAHALARFISAELAGLVG